MAAAALIAATVIAAQQRRISVLTEERDKHQANAQTLLADVEHWQTKDSLNAAKVGVLNLKIGEYEKFRAEDAALIESLKMKGRDIAGVTSTSTSTRTEVKTVIRDSVVYLKEDTVRTVLRCIDFADAWTDIHGCAAADTFSGMIISRDSLLIVESVKYKRFLWWKTKKVKDRDFRIVSRNPRTRIEGFEVITIER